MCDVRLEAKEDHILFTSQIDSLERKVTFVTINKQHDRALWNYNIQEINTLFIQLRKSSESTQLDSLLP